MARLKTGTAQVAYLYPYSARTAPAGFPGTRRQIRRRWRAASCPPVCRPRWSTARKPADLHLALLRGAKYATLSGHTYSPEVVVFSLTTWKKIPAKYHEETLKASAGRKKFNRELSAKMDKEYVGQAQVKKA